MGNAWRNPGIVNSFVAIGLLAVWLNFAPVQLGGETAFVIINGNSMEPGFQDGDLVIVRHADEYHVGDVIAYKDADLSAYVIHRILRADNLYFTTRGDHNAWIDEYRPRQSEIVGKLWIYLPKLGIVADWMRLPIHLALITGLLGGFLMLNIAASKPAKTGNRKKRGNGNATGLFEISVYALVIMALVFSALVVLGFSRPVSKQADKIAYSHTGVFIYSASSIPGVYDSTSIHSGEPVFTKLTCTINLGFIYTLSGAQPENITGHQQFTAVVVDEQSGWKRTLPLTSDINFSGNTHTSTATLDLCEVENLVAKVEEKTGFHLSTYSLAIDVPVSVKGQITGIPFADSFDPHLTFKFDKLHFFVVSESSQTDPLQTVKTGALNNPGMVDNTIQFLGVNFPIGGIRSVGIIGLIIALFGLIGVAGYFYLVSKQGTEALINLKYGSIIMNVYDRGLKNLTPVIDVATIDDLAKLAERQGLMIMHLPWEYAHYYLVQIEGTTYRYVTSNGARQVSVE